MTVILYYNSSNLSKQFWWLVILTETRHIPVNAYRQERPPFKLLGGWLCLDFIDTVNWDAPERERERFFSYTDLVDWAHFVGNLADREAQHLRQQATLRPEEATVIYEQALNLRATMHRIFSAVSTAQSPTATDLATFNAALSETLARARLRPGERHFVWTWPDDEEALGRVLWPILKSAAELLTSEKLDRVGKCAGDSCGWLFFDTSRNRSRRWCEMEHCGNRAKARRHYRRKRAGEALF
jgi:predicted RNA-binding Zn ribbon-like protein